ncbi:MULTISPECIES: hypothetical protein [unclassified Streptomyces]|uniref:hypothetical protein n=1 Tax=unclassified Streptomyces TaxID=2593676 RepID=UPI000DC2DB01|nr:MULTISPECIES: hypothetical protein [unclassified Streptomyces]RAJ72682.1 hypothetical protein K377_07236 [Streptomyces sp. PsTaAH-137]
MNAVLETSEVRDFALWPVADSPAGHLLALSGRLSVRELGTAMEVLTNYNKGDGEVGTRGPRDSTELVSELLTADQVIAPGGIRIRDTSTGVTAPPGCCFGLENWRDWLDCMNGEEPWLGHDPTPRAECIGATVRLWPDVEHPDGLRIELPLVQLPELLGSVQAQLVAFLAAVDQRATRYAPSLADALVAKLDEDLAITAPLQEGQG